MKHARDKHKSTKRDTAKKTADKKREYDRGRDNARTGSAREGTLSGSQSPAAQRIRAKRAAAAKKAARKSQFLAKLRVVLVIGVCVGLVIGLGVGAGMYAAVSQEIDEMDFEGIAYNFSSIVYANDAAGNSIEVEYLHSDGNREWIESDMIPEIAKEAAISIEDERFYKHSGVDIKRTAGAVIGWVKAKITGTSPSYGGSTITQQVIKNITNEKDRTVTRKVKEMMRAIAFEKRFTKEEILSMYLNIVYFGNQCYGIESSAKMYFSKNAIDLTLPEAAMIVGITQAPSRFNPFKNPEDTIAKRNTVLKKMYELEKITEEEYNEAVNSPLGVNDRYKALNSTVYSYFVDQVINDIISDLQTQKGYSQTFASQQVFSGGLKIYTTMDADIQDAIESVYTNKSNFAGAANGTQSAMVIIDPYTGEIKGMAGGIGTKTESRGLNRATQSRRQPGSSVKPLSVYAPALETGKITAATILTDEPITIGDWSPKNSYSGFKGDMSVRRAIEISANIPAVKTLQSLGIDTSFNFMTNKYRFTSLENSDKNLSALGLGGMTTGVSPKEMASAYGTFVNKGVHITPHTYTKVLDSSGKVLLEAKPEKTRVISEANAFIMTSFLKDVVNGSSGTGRGARLSGITAYGKTGTSNDNKDKWFCGYTPYYVGAVWYGYDAEKSVGSTNVSTQIWKKVMQKVHEGLPAKTFEQPDNVTAVSVCQKTGKLSSSGCSYGKTEYFVKGTLPTKYCGNKHGTTNVSASESPNTETSPSPSPSATPDVNGEGAVTIVPTESVKPTATPKPTVKPTATPSAATSAPSTGNDDVITLD
ncbi:MAG: PBP1A family penicillin-binding protein [Clostridia bacterium]|nr:PBP1A family penicillin-binding protein [Clostridia bacterium]